MENCIELAFLFILAFAGGFTNTTVGGGWFIIFPGLIFRGILPVFANATTMLSLWTGHVFASDPVRDGTRIYLPNLRYLILSCAVGGLLGACLVVLMPHRIFEHVGPFLLLGSFLLFSCYRQILDFSVSRIPTGKEFEYSHSMLVTLFFVGIYGGYFGAGMGMIVFILYRSYGIQEGILLDRVASVLVAANTGSALVVYAYSGLIAWPFVLALMAGSLTGAYLGLHSGNKINRATVKKIMIGIGAIVTFYFVNLVM